MQQAQVADVDRQAIYTHFDPPPSSGLGMGLLPDQVEPCAQTSKRKWYKKQIILPRPPPAHLILFKPRGPRKGFKQKKEFECLLTFSI